MLSIKTGGCPEDCKYCPQSSRYKTGLESERLMQVAQVLEAPPARPRRPVLPASVWGCVEKPHERDMPYLQQMVQG